MRRNYSGQVWTYDDETVIGPVSYMNDYEGNQINIWDEMLQVNMSVIRRASKSQMILPRGTWDAIIIWAETGFGGMELHDYLNRMLSKCGPQSQNTSES